MLHRGSFRGGHCKNRIEAFFRTGSKKGFLRDFPFGKIAYQDKFAYPFTLTIPAMKTRLISFCLLFGSIACFSQNTERLQADDSARIEYERSKLLKELTGLRDSINQSLTMFSRSIRKTTPKKDKQLKTASQDLAQYRDRLKLDIQQVQLTAKNGWSTTNIKRIKDDSADIRKEHKRIIALYENP
jgi:hypothetical protein